ncbi:hypothetical protein HLB01_01190 [Bordetella trematum]|uniref:hypothetical protein n=1 Tax=Bordetella trematum TaxID=123899 RepID=UPI000A991A40|nr:hypothetical protein [Bordetella trematum]NNH17646.1 hypothetical protein [Bordetella trematum]
MFIKQLPARRINRSGWLLAGISQIPVEYAGQPDPVSVLRFAWAWLCLAVNPGSDGILNKPTT